MGWRKGKFPPECNSGYTEMAQVPTPVLGPLGTQFSHQCSAVYNFSLGLFTFPFTLLALSPATQPSSMAPAPHSCQFHALGHWHHH